MPIILNNANNKSVKNSTKSAYNVKFFHKDFTGNGKSVGLINASMNPANLSPLLLKIVGPLFDKIKTNTTKYSKTVTYPIDPLGNYSRLNTKPKALKQNTCELAVDGITKLFVEFTPVSIGITEALITANQAPGTTPVPKKLSVVYRIDFIRGIQNVVTNSPEYSIIEESFTQNPAALMRDMIQNQSIFIGQYVFKIDNAHMTNYDTYLNGYDLYSELNDVSKTWQTTITDEIILMYDAHQNNFPMRAICRYISLYRISMSQYQRFYQELIKRFTSAEIKLFTQVNTYLLLQDTMENMKKIQFAPLQNPTNIANYKSPDFSWCSKEQLAAITSAEPLNLVQAGAGTGKSTTIMARIEYLLSVGVKPDDILVLSFTNAAANNMKSKTSNIQSMTIAKMIDTIYCQNHPNHKLASAATRKGEGSTFTNSLEMYSETNPMADKLIKASYLAESRNDYATLLNLVEDEYDDVIALLDQVGQTTFQLEIILTYIEHAKLTIPFNIKHLIIDEVQDNAVFEFIFFLNLTCKLASHLYLVGDCSQTLYEFRASDPKALSVIENSCVFKTFPLNINYRSNQAILSFANALLTDIEANQNAHIQLQSFKLSQLTQQDFKDAVTVDYEKLNKIKELPENLDKRFKNKITPWIDDKLHKKEQICVLTYSRHDSAMLQNMIAKLYPKANIVSIIPAKNISFAYFSKYVSFCKSKLQALPTTSATNLCNTVRSDIIFNLTNCNIDPTKPQYNQILGKVSELINKWEKENIAVIGDYLIKLKAGIITHDELIKIIGESLVDFEITQNALKQTISSQRNASRKTSTDSADFIFSTIHSAKGLEFDNVILLYQNENNMTEADKRMYYVALTRAKKAEYIIGYGNVVNALISSRHETVLQRLPLSIAINTNGQVISVTNKDGSVLNADGTGFDIKGNVLNANGTITMTSGEILTPNKNGAFDLTKKKSLSAVAV
jgi:DNA helicase-2/ATP-dependent DNA helicase PcrA